MPRCSPKLLLRSKDQTCKIVIYAKKHSHLRAPQKMTASLCYWDLNLNPRVSWRI